MVILRQPATDRANGYRKKLWLEDKNNSGPAREGERELGDMSAYFRDIEAEVDTSVGTVSLVHERFRTPIDIWGTSNFYHLQLALYPYTRPSLGCYDSHWSPHRFEPMGELFFLFPTSSTHTISWCEEQRSLICRIDEAKAIEWLGPDFEWTDGSLMGGLNIASAEVRRLMYRIAAELENPGHASTAMIEALVTQACIELSRYLRERGGDDAKGGLAPWRMRIVEDEVARDPGGCSAETLARRCGFSVRQLSRAFRASRGQTLAEFIAGHRFRLAQDLLKDGASVKEAAYAAGFASPSNFATAFQRELGCAPSEYRARHVSRALP